MNPLTIVIFGASGDLTARKLVPALYHLFAKGRLPREYRVVGVSRSPWSDEHFREHLVPGAQEASGPAWDEAKWRDFAGRMFYVSGDATAPGGLDGLREWLRKREGKGPADRLYYLSVAPELVPGIVEQMGKAGLAQEEGGFRRLV